MKKVVILAAAALTLAACAKTYELQENAQPKIGFSTWNETMTKAAKTAFAANDEFDVYGFKWNAGPANQTTVFDGVDVKFDGTKWSYSPLRFWDSNFDNYTFFAAYPKDQLADGEYAQNGYFVSQNLAYDGQKEVLLVAQKKDVEKTNYNKTVELKFKHVGSLVDIKVKKHSDIESAKVEVTSIAVSGIKTTGAFTVSSYDASNNPVGSWAATSAVNDATVAPYHSNSTVTLAKNAGVGTANASNLLTDLVLMPQELAKDGGPKITISYKITTGEDATADEITFSDKSFYFGQFDKSEEGESEKANKENDRISAWMPGVHYTYYITINANAITFTASIDDWSTETGHYYLVY
jgi:hypothetical protein